MPNLKIYPHLGNCRCAPTGERYLSFDSGGIRLEGQRHTMFQNRHEAWDNFRKYLDIYESKGGTLYWRLKPTMVMGRLVSEDEPWWTDYRQPLKFTVIARLLVSDKPMIQSHDGNEINK